MASAAIRSIKNVTKGYSAVQVKVRNATSNDPWGPTGAEMAEIASMTFNGPQDFVEIVDMLEKRLNDKGKNWRHVLKSLKVVDYCIHEGSDLCVTWARKNLPVIKTLESFENVDEDGKDVGAAIRASAKELSSLIRDEERLRAERAGGKWQSRVHGSVGDGYGSQVSPTRQRRDRPKRRGSDEDVEYRLALEASKAEAEAESRRRANGDGQEDNDLAQAIKLSKEEDELRRRELERQNAESLFDDTPAATQPTGYNQGYQQQVAVDWYGNPMDQQQPQTTGYLNNMYTQPMQPQYTSFQQPQQTGFMPQYMPAQATGYNPWANSMNGMQQQQQQQQQPQQQPAPVEQPQPTGSNNPWASNNQQQAMAPMPTGSNNPFASKMASSTNNTQRAPSLSTLQEQRTSQFPQQSNPIMNYQAPQPAAAPAPVPQPAKNPVSPHHAQLNALLAGGAGLDTYGNTGDLRMPAQHTAPGTYVNSAGQGLNQLEVHRTGTNPFLHNQFTGMAQTQYPAPTGPAGRSQGAGASYGGYQGQQQQGGQSGSLIDL